jgi:ABC-type multidrug transport system ATPase subunit
VNTDEVLKILEDNKITNVHPKMKAVEFINVTKKLKNGIAVNNMSCVFEAGKVTTLWGPPESGKTTILKLVTGEETPTSGKVIINQEVTTFDEEKFDKKKGETVVCSTHDPQHAMNVSDHVLVINSGMILESGKPRDMIYGL